MTKSPLSWPSGWKRTPSNCREKAKFSKTSSSGWKTSLTIDQGTTRVREALRLMGIDYQNIIISTNLILRRDELPRSGQPEPADPGVAVYWKKDSWKQHKVMAIDQYDRVADNLAAIAATLDAMRAIERYGGAIIIERAFMGFDSLPSPNDWRHVMGFKETPTHVQAKDRYLDLCKKRHPDMGGTEAAMKELNAAWEDAKRELINGGEPW